MQPILINNRIKIVVGILLLSFQFNSHGQTFLKTNSNFKLNVSGVLYQPYEFKSFGYNNLKLKIAPSFQVGFGYNKILKKNWSLDVDLLYSLMGHIIEWHELVDPFVNDKFYYPGIILETTYNDHKFSIESGISKAFHLKDDFYLQFSYIIGFNSFILDDDFIMGQSHYDKDGNLIGESYLSMVRSNTGAYDFSFSNGLKIGILKENKKHLYSIRFVYNLAPKVLGFGTFKLDAPHFEGGGILYKQSSYFGLEYSHYFHLKRK